MGKFSFGGCLQAFSRANSKNLAGWVEGTVTHLKSGELQVALEDRKVVCFALGAEDIVITKENVESIECAAQNFPRKYGNNTMICNSYAVVMKNGEFGTFEIFVGKAAEFLMIMKP